MGDNRVEHADGASLNTNANEHEKYYAANIVVFLQKSIPKLLIFNYLTLQRQLFDKFKRNGLETCPKPSETRPAATETIRFVAKRCTRSETTICCCFCCVCCKRLTFSVMH